MTRSSPACRADLRPRLAYSAALLLLCACTAALALDPLLLADTVRTRENDTSYAPLPQTHNESGLGRAVQLRIPSPLRLLEPLDGVLFAATTSRAAQPDGRHPDGSPCLFVGTLQEFEAAQRGTLPGQRHPGLLTSYARPGRRFLRAGGADVACVDGESAGRLRALRGEGAAMLAAVLLLWALGTVAVWLFCAGWCSCALPRGRGRQRVSKQVYM